MFDVSHDNLKQMFHFSFQLPNFKA